MTIAYIRTYSNKQQTESQKNAIEQFAKAKKIEIDKWLIFLSLPMSLDSAGN